MFDLETDDFVILKSILSKYPYQFYAFGSRVKGNNKKSSDLDLCIIGDISNTQLYELINELAESNLRIKIDLKRWQDINDGFRAMIQNDLTIVNLNNE
jgi:predicted nucleotidyltransferase